MININSEEDINKIKKLINKVDGKGLEPCESYIFITGPDDRDKIESITMIIDKVLENVGKNEKCETTVQKPGTVQSVNKETGKIELMETGSEIGIGIRRKTNSDIRYP